MADLPTSAADDESVLRDSGYATQSLIAGAIGVLLVPVVVGFIPAAIGLHAGVTHIRFRAGSRLRAWLGLALSGVAAIGSAGAMIAWGGVLLSILLQRSAIDQARQWAGLTPAPWILSDTDGGTHDSAALRGRLVYIDVCSPDSPYSPAATAALNAFAARHPEVTALSWCPGCGTPEAKAYRAGTASALPIAAGMQSMGEPLSLIPATPTLVVIDEAGALRLVHPGTYTEAELVALMTAPTPAPKGVLGRPRMEGSAPAERPGDGR